MLIRTAEPAFLVPGLDSGCAAPGLDSEFVAVGLICSELVGPPVISDCAGAPAVPVLLESEPVCALAGKASIAAKRGTIAKLRKCLGEASKHMSCPLSAKDQPFQHLYKP